MFAKTRQWLFEPTEDHFERALLLVFVPILIWIVIGFFVGYGPGWAYQEISNWSETWPGVTGQG